MSRQLPAFSIFALLSVLVACGGTTPPADEPTTEPGACSVTECGPAPAGEAELCDDGEHRSGPSGRCLRNEEGVCHHEVLTCPAPAPRVCGGMVAGQEPCHADEFCDYPLEATCGAADGTGICRVRPQACTMDFSPVCGCDDHTYPNACGAAAAGVSVATLGECPVRAGALGDTCGTRGVPPCGEGLFCNFPSTANCGRADAPGTCAERPTTCDSRVRRVCGCDATTYANACAANLAGVSVETNGACRAR